MNRSNWPQVRLGEHVDLLSGFPFKSQHFTDNRTDVPLVKGANVHQGYIDWNDSKFWPMEDTADYSKYFLSPGDVVLAMDRPWIEAGLKFAWILPQHPKALLVQRVSRMRGMNGLSTRYLRFVIGSEQFTDYIRPIVTGINVPHISAEQIKAFRFALPPLQVQEKIASILSAYDDLIENNTRRMAILEAMAHAIYREWFVEFRFPGHEKVKLVESPLGKIPEGWSVRTLGEIASITMGTSPSSDTYNEEGCGTPLINGPVEFDERFTRLVKWTTAPNKLCKEGDLVVCVRGSTTGRYVKSDGVYCLGRGVCALSSKYQCFVDILFEKERPALLAKAGGSTFPSWTGPQLKCHPVVSPPEDVLALFEDQVKPMRIAIFAYSRQIQNLRKTRDLLLPKLISGQLNVEDLDIDTGQVIAGELAEAGS